jgi:hypothetical protein
LTAIVAEALKKAQPEGLAVDEVTMSLEGEIINTRRIYG